MKILVAPNALKGSLSATDAARAIAEGASRADASVATVAAPVADGGDGLADVLAESLSAERVTTRVRGPNGADVDAAWLYVAESCTAVVEMATASGLALIDAGERDALGATTRGTGELITAALDRGATHVIVGVGGSATTDLGAGMASALGIRFLDDQGTDVAPCGGELARVSRIDASGTDPHAGDAKFEVLCDVDNPLLGPRGAARVYSPQKGATPEQVERLEAGLAHLAEVIARDLGVDVREMKGAGAAGGLSAGLHAFLGAELRPGADVVLDLVGFHEKVRDAALVITAEGHLDDQTSQGKAPAAVARAAQAAGVPCVCIAGAVARDRAPIHATGFASVFSLCDGPVSLESAMADGYRLLSTAAEEVVRTFLAGRNRV